MLFYDKKHLNEILEKIMKIVVVGAGYVGLSNAILLAQNNEVYVIDVIKEKVDMICCIGEVSMTLAHLSEIYNCKFLEK